MGGSLYYLGGYSLPFYFFSVISIMCLPYIKMMYISNNEEEDVDEGFFKYLFDGVNKYKNY